MEYILIIYAIKSINFLLLKTEDIIIGISKIPL